MAAESTNEGGGSTRVSLSSIQQEQDPIVKNTLTVSLVEELLGVGNRAEAVKVLVQANARDLDLPLYREGWLISQYNESVASSDWEGAYSIAREVVSRGDNIVPAVIATTSDGQIYDVAKQSLIQSGWGQRESQALSAYAEAILDDKDASIVALKSIAEELRNKLPDTQDILNGIVKRIVHIDLASAPEYLALADAELYSLPESILNEIAAEREPKWIRTFERLVGSIIAKVKGI
jgi:hypothetical protein